jgi:hypothetical protein
MQHPMKRKVLAFALLTLVAVAAVVPAAQARVSAATVSNIDAIEARWHDGGYNVRTRPRVSLPSGFARHKGSISPVVASHAPVAGVTVKHTDSSDFNWTAFAVGTSLAAIVALAFAGTRMVRGRRLATS